MKEDARTASFDLLHVGRAYLGWVMSLSRKLISNTGNLVAGAVLTYILSQLCSLVAFLLPLKILLLASRDTLPGLVARWVPEDGRVMLIVLLAVGTLVCFWLHLVLERRHHALVERGAGQLVLKAGKLLMFAKQGEMASRFFGGYCRSAGALLLLGVYGSLSWLLNSVLTLVVVGLLTCTAVIIYTLARSGTRRGGWLVERLDSQLPKVLEALTASVFLIAFFVILWQLLTHRLDSALVAMISLLLVRRATSTLSGALRDAHRMWQSRLEINALFYAGHRYQPKPDPVGDKFKTLLMPARRGDWLASILRTSAALECRDVRTRWLDSSPPGCGLIRVMDEAANDQLLVKAFSRRQLRLADHERSLFEAMPTLPLSPRYRGRLSVAEGELLLFDPLPTKKPGKKHWRSIHAAAQSQLLQTSLDTELLGKAIRSHQKFFFTLTQEKLAWLEIACDSPAATRALVWLMSALPDVQKQLDALPLVLNNPALNGLPHVWLTDDDRVLCSHWSGWRFEPLGASLPLNAHSRALIAGLDDIRQACRLSQAEFADAVQTCGYLFRLSRLLQQQRWRAAVELLIGFYEQAQNDSS